MSNTDFPVIIGPAGAQPTPPSVLLAELLALVASTNPGYTATLPGSLIEDVSSTEVGGLAVTDSARVETINSLTPYAANAFLLSQLGQVYIGPGAAPAPPTNTSVFVVFTASDTATSAPITGQVIPIGFTVSDGTYQYVVQDGGATGAGGVTMPLFCIATIAGTWPVPTNTVTQLVTPAPPGVTLTFTNQVAGVSGAVAETEEQYRARVVIAGRAVCQGLPETLKTALGRVAGVQQNLISTRQQPGAWEIIVGGGDPYEVANAIVDSGVNVAGIVGSTLAVTAITAHNPGNVTTDINHLFTTGQVIEMTGIVGPPLNNTPYTITVVDEKNFTIGLDTTSMPAYVSGGVVTPNLRNVTVSINDYPDIYSVTFVNPPLQTVTIAVTWDTTATNFVSQAAVAQLAAPAIAAYVNALAVGEPMSLILLDRAFTDAVASVLDASTISVLDFAVSINGVSTLPIAGSPLILGDPESYFSTSAPAVSVTQS
jgi:hypothetical protein